MSNSSRFLALAGMLLSWFVAAPVAWATHTDSPQRDFYRTDPSGRVARLNQVQGEVSYSPAGEDDWIEVARNRPLVRGDRLWTDRGARAELQVGGAIMRLGADTSFQILNLNDRIAQVRLAQGTLYLRVHRLYPGQSYEVATPTLAFTVSRAGRYRIDVDERRDQTTIVVWEGAGEAWGDRAHFPLRSGDSVRFYDDDLRDHELFGLPRADSFDRYCLDRDRRLESSRSLRYLNDDVVGYGDLDEYGDWYSTAGYGPTWYPRRVDAGWAPYRDGHWVWQEPWGWTWVDEEPWGFAPSHYGRWVHTARGWGWIPGPRNVRPVYAPALVAFVSGRGWSVSLSLGQNAPIGWFPLAPREVYVPSYPASREYFNRVNVNNTVVNNTTITNVYNNTYNYGSGNTTTNNTNINQVTYANRAVPGAVTAVPSTVFVNAQPVRPAAIRVEGHAAVTGEVTRVAPVAPSSRSVLGPGPDARARPPREAQERRVVARNAPPPAQRPFAAREQQLQQQPGQVPAPVIVQSAPASAVPSPTVRVVDAQPGAVNAREAGSRRAGGKVPRGGTAKLQPLERAADGAPPAVAEQAAQQAAQQQVERQRKFEDEKRAIEQQRVERERQVAAQQQAEQQRLADAQREEKRRARTEGEARQVVVQQQAERQRMADKHQDQQRELKAQNDRDAERLRLAEAELQEQERRAECERMAVDDHRECRDGPPSQQEPGKGNGRGRDKDAGQSSR